ncbi:MAG: hypothetical protein ACE5ID_10180, partial [Acidobacteriota bacterium]
LDPVTARHIRQFIREKLADQEGKTILLATHNLHEAADLCDRMAIMAGSQIYRTGRLDQFRSLLSAGRRYRLVTDRPVDLTGVALLVQDHSKDGRQPPPARGISTLIEPLKNGDPELTGVIRKLASDGIRVLDLSREEVSLEDLFQELFQKAPLQAKSSTKSAS